MKKPFPKMILRILLVCVLLLGFLYMDDDIGTSAANLESDIRNLQKIPEDWIVEGDVSDTMAAYISYPQDRSDHTFSVYVNRPGLSFGYFFRGGGSLSGVERGIAEFTVDGSNERAFISMNQPKAARLEIDDGNTVQIIDLNSDQPFAIVLPANAGVIHFYDGDGNPVKYQKNPLLQTPTSNRV